MHLQNIECTAFLQPELIEGLPFLQSSGIPIKAIQIDLDSLSESQKQELAILYAQNYDLDSCSEALEILRRSGATLSCSLIAHLQIKPPILTHQGEG